MNVYTVGQCNISLFPNLGVEDPKLRASKKLEIFSEIKGRAALEKMVFQKHHRQKSVTNENELHDFRLKKKIGVQKRGVRKLGNSKNASSTCIITSSLQRKIQNIKISNEKFEVPTFSEPSMP